MLKDSKYSFWVFLLSAALVIFTSLIPQADLSPMAAWWAYDTNLIVFNTIFGLLVAGASASLLLNLWWLSRRLGAGVGGWLPMVFCVFLGSLCLAALVSIILIWWPVYWLSVGVKGICAISGTAAAVSIKMRRHELANLVQYLVFKSGGA